MSFWLSFIGVLTTTTVIVFTCRHFFPDMSQQMAEDIQAAALTWPEVPTTNKIDTHHHFVPDFYAEAVEKAGGDPSGWPTPTWSIQRSLNMMERLGVQTAILSVTAPGPCILQGQASYDLARRLNLHAAELRDKQPHKIGFFASLPSLLDTDAALEELRFALDKLHADGVTLFTRYGSGNTYLGHADLSPIWSELNRRKTTVFIHPTHPVDTNKVSPQMPQPMIDYPHETTRAAMDMILSGTRLKYPDCKVILSHAGGNLPYIISRVATPLAKTPRLAAKTMLGVTRDEVMRAFRSFHFDLALSSSPAVLSLLLDTVPRDHILFGSDYPYAPLPAYPAFVEDLEEFEMDKQLRDGINFGNASRLFPRLADVRSKV